MIALHAAPTEIYDNEETREDRMQRILFRLEDGFEKIARAADAGEDVSRWEDVWIHLLNEYERLHDQIAA